MKRIIRLTESDLTRIVRRVIRENEWSDEEEMEYQDIKSKGPYLKDFDNDISKWEPEFVKWRDDPKHVELKNKKSDYESKLRAKQEEDRYSNVVKNRPSDFDADTYQDEYDQLGTKVGDFKKGAPYLKDFDNDISKWEKSYKKYQDETGINDTNKRRQELSRQLDRDRKGYGNN
jgi:hypothetical protein